MFYPGTCPNCGNIYGNEPRRIPCGHIVCHKCCLALYNKEDNSLDCPACSCKHVFKSKNTFKKASQQVAYSGFGKKTSTRETSFASAMPVEKATALEKSADKEVKKAAANLSTIPPDVPSETSSISKQSKLVDAVAKLPTSVNPTIVESSKNDDQWKIAQQQTTSNILSPPSLFSKIVSPPASSSDIVTARCHSCGIKCEVFVCDHCEVFVCLKCADEHRTTTTNVDTRDLTIKRQECKNKYDILRQKLGLLLCFFFFVDYIKYE